MTIRILLADDHALMREGLRALLVSASDISVIGEVRTGREAVIEADRLVPDVIVMDLAMPDLNGIEAARLIRTRHPATRIVMLSMHSTAEHVYRALDAGASGYLLKETVGDEVIAAVRAVHAGKQYLCTALAASVRDFTGLVHARGPLDSLSPRERQVLQMVVEGKTSNEIAQVLSLSPKSVETYRNRLMTKLHVDNVPSLVKFAVELGLTPHK